MTAIWQNNESGWHLPVRTDFQNEAILHKLVEEAPHLLPLAGTPRLNVAGREVQLGSGYADLIAKEPSGRLAIIEIKLDRNAEARRAVIAQVLAARTPVRDLLRKLCDWAVTLEQARLVGLYTYHGRSGILTLLPRMQADGVGLVSIYNNNGSAYLQFWRCVFVRSARNALARIEASIMPIKQGNTTREMSDELLEKLTAAYKEANSRAIKVEEFGE